MAAHIRVGGIRPTHFARWLHLFRQTAAETCPPEVAAVFDAKAQNIARSLQMGIDASQGVLPDRPVSARSVAMES
jgi:hemoglobin